MKPIEMIPLASGDANFVSLWVDSCRRAQEDLDNWIELLRKTDVKAAHPDDGWVDRKLNRVHFAYPHFNDGVKVGDTIVLGQPDKFRRVTVTGQDHGLLDYWRFKPL